MTGHMGRDHASDRPAEEMGATVPPSDDALPAEFGDGPDDDIPF